jgi:hypothetical protein
LICFSLVLIPIASLIGGLVFAFVAFIYNQTVRWTGGLELTMVRKADQVAAKANL